MLAFKLLPDRILLEIVSFLPVAQLDSIHLVSPRLAAIQAAAFTARKKLVLVIGLPSLNEWERLQLTQFMNRPQHLKHKLNLTEAPFLDLQLAQQITAKYSSITTLELYVSMLNLDYRQCTNIMAGIEALLTGRWWNQLISFKGILEVERGHPEHEDITEQWISLDTWLGPMIGSNAWQPTIFGVWSNSRTDAASMLSSGDNDLPVNEENFEDD